MGTVNPTVVCAVLLLVACGHNQVNSTYTQTTFICLSVSAFRLAVPLATDCYTKHKFRGGFVRGQRVGIDGEALFMHPPCSSKKSASFPLVSVSHQDTFCKMEIVYSSNFGEMGPDGWAPRRGRDVKGHGLKGRWLWVGVQR